MRPSGEQFELVCGPVRAVVVEVGGGLRTLSHRGRDLVDGYEPSELCPACAGQVLLPWPNRVADGRYSFEDTAHQLPLTEPARHNAIHGLVRWLPWSVLERGTSAIELGCTLFPSPGYPWSLRLRTRWTASNEGLRAEHFVQNVGEGRAPLGFGVHPYLGVPGRSVDELWLHLPAKTLIRTDDRLLPLGEEPVGELSFCEPRSLRGVQLDTAFGQLVREADGTVRASLTDADGVGVTLRADAGTRWWQVYTSDTLPGARHRRSVAIEPMTCPPDALRSGRDLQILEPGQEWSGWWELSPA